VRNLVRIVQQARNELASCKYQDSKSRTTAHEDEHGDRMRQRIDHLEDLVKKLIAQNQEVPVNKVISSSDSSVPGTKSAKNTEAPDAIDVASTAGTTVIDGVHSVYNSADDWFNVLQEVSHLFVLPFFYLSLCLIWRHQTNCSIDKQAQAGLR
jgi:hypothetical protein